MRLFKPSFSSTSKLNKISQIGALGTLSLLIAASAQSQEAASTPTKAQAIFKNGQAQVVPEFQDKTKWIRQELWVETEFDSDGDGKPDRVHVDVIRPLQTQSEGLKVPVVYASSPYYAGGMKEQKMWDVKQELGAEPPKRIFNKAPDFVPVRPIISNDEVDTWVPRGFAVVHSEAPGTGLSQGCPTVGGAPEELAPKAVIDWLNGRAKGYTQVEGGELVIANWSTGKVGMTGTSYNGTIPLAAATTGVAGLEAIIPIAPNTSYYHYYRSNGLVKHPGGYLGEDIDQLYDFIYTGATEKRAYCNATYRDGQFMQQFDRRNGDYNAFWADRDLLKKISKVKAATLIAHGQHDWNVMPEHSIRIFDALKKNGVTTQLYLHHGGHGGPPPMEMRNRWFSHFLYGIENDVEKDPKAMIMRENAERGSKPTAYADFPNPDAKMLSLNLGAGGNKVGDLSLTKPSKSGIEKLIDNVEFTGELFAKEEQSTHRLIYATPKLTAPLHMSGTPVIKIRMAANKAAANLSVWLVTLPFDGSKVGSAGQLGVVSRAWADPQNHASLTQGGDYHSMQAGQALKPGQFVDLTFDLQPGDRIIPAGKRLALMIMSSDKEFTLWPKAGTQLQVDLQKTSLSFPVVGGEEAWKKAFDMQ